MRPRVRGFRIFSSSMRRARGMRPCVLGFPTFIFYTQCARGVCAPACADAQRIGPIRTTWSGMCPSVLGFTGSSFSMNCAHGESVPARADAYDLASLRAARACMPPFLLGRPCFSSSMRCARAGNASLLARIPFLFFTRRWGDGSLLRHRATDPYIS